MHRQACIYVAGGDTLLGAALVQHLRRAGFMDLVGVPPCEPDLTHADEVEDFFKSVRPEFVFLAAGPSGGIEENRRHPADLMLDNLLIATNVLPAAFRHGVRKLLYVASACCYPTGAPQPLKVESLLTGSLEPASEPYALAKLAALKLCQAYRRQYDAPFITAVPASLFGPGDDFHPDSGHVIPALMHRFHKAKQLDEGSVQVWGSGRPRRDFLFAADAADACAFLMEHYDDPEPINIGSQAERAIADVAEALAGLTGFRGQIHFDPRRPDGAARKLLDASPLFGMGWRPRTDFRDALAATYAWYCEHVLTEESHARAAV